MQDEIVIAAHGGGGRLTRDLLESWILPEFDGLMPCRLDDAAVLEPLDGPPVISTDSYVVDPPFFPGGDIGSLAVSGTVNDILMQGGSPRCITLGLILHEGFPLRDLRRLMKSAARTAREAGVGIVAGDTKVIGPGGGPGLYINTTGLGVLRPGFTTGVEYARQGDAVIVTGYLGDHGVAVLSGRERLGMEYAVKSDAAPLTGLLEGLLGADSGVHCLRDPTRGGLTVALCDIAEASHCGVHIREEKIPIREEVHGVCDILGFDPLNIANEGKAVIVCAPESLCVIMNRLRAHPLGTHGSHIGEISPEPAGRVLLATTSGGTRVLSIPPGGEIPRIC